MTGAGAGFGRGIVKKLVAEGAKVNATLCCVRVSEQH